LTANADYGVSIVESFVPPKNWLPGQEINKDVYAVNTGNVDAFVKEKITGVLNYTYEQLVDSWDENCVVLNDNEIHAIDGATTEEAGGFLAWTNAVVDTVPTDILVIGSDEVTEASFTPDNTTMADPTDPDDDSKDKAFTKKITIEGTDFYVESVAAGQKLYTKGEETSAGSGKFKFVESDKIIQASQKQTGGHTYATGPVNSARIDDSVDGRWIPPAEGIYIFRRSIDTKANDTSIFDDTINPDSAKRANFTYAGYYYKPGTNPNHSDDKYYEIVIGDDTHPVSNNNGYGTATDSAPYADWRFDTSATSAQVGKRIDVNGVILEEPTVRFVKEVEVKNADATFLYNGGDASNPATLTVSYTPGQADTTRVTETKAAYDEALAAENAFKAEALGYSAAAAKAERDYEDALGSYNTKKSRYDQTDADWNYANDLVTATNKLFRAADDRAIFQKKLNDAESNKNNAWNNTTTATTIDSVVERATQMRSTTNTDPYYLVQDLDNGANANVSFKSLFGSDNNTATPTAPSTGTTLAERINYLYSTIGTPNSRFTRLKSNMDQMYTLWGKINDLWNGKTVEDDPLTTDVDESLQSIVGIKNDLDALKSTTPITSTKAKEIRERLDTTLAQFKAYFDQYQKLYANIKRDADDTTELTLTDLVDANNTVVGTTATQAIDLYDTGFKATDTGLEALIKKYETAYDTWHAMADEDHPTQEGTLGKANADWTSAITTYNNDVYDTATTSAYNQYKTRFNAVQPELNAFNRLSGSTVNERKLSDQSKLIIAEEDSGVKKYVPQLADANTAKIPTNTTYTTYADPDNVTESEGVYSMPTASQKKVSVAAHDDFKQIDITEETLTNGNPKAEDLNKSGTAPDIVYTAKKLSELQSDVTDAWADIDGQGDGDKKAAYDTAKAKDEGAADEIRRLEGVTERTKAAYDTAVLGGSPVNIIINLAANEENLEWQYDTTNVGTHEEGKPGTEANFYYKHVLKGGDTSAKLIDSVYLDKNTTAKAYKTLVFDLNVGLDSIQVTYDADQRNYSTEVVNAEDTNFKLDVTSPASIPDNTTTLTWGTTAP
jgi:hypothetical protein